MMLIDPPVLPGSPSQLEVQLLPDWWLAVQGTDLCGVLTDSDQRLSQIRPVCPGGHSNILTCETEMTKYALLNKDRVTRQTNKIQQDQYHVKKTNTRYASQPYLAPSAVLSKVVMKPELYLVN